MATEGTPLPIQYLQRDVLRVMESHIPPAYTSADYLKMFDLTAPDPDGKTLADRFLGDERTAFVHFDDLLYTVRMIESLVKRLESGHLSQNEATLAANLAAVAVAQIQREGDICDTASNFARRVSAVRPDLISPDIID
ncbi:hypothetical protein HY949_02520 [Candidatus Gottesmanbacteria bacterium]|nr:hypothetical protein [Candidatus Gottesmanbacteria bacterium]